MKKHIFILAFFSLFFTSCKTKSEIRREQEIERLRGELRDSRGDQRTDSENTAEEFKVEIGKLNNLVEERAVQAKRQVDDLHEELKVMEQRIIGLEQKVNALTPSLNTVEKVREDEDSQDRERPLKNSMGNAKKLFDEGKYEEASEMFRVVARKSRGEDQKKAFFWVGESLFTNKDYANAALEFGEFRKNYPRDGLVPQAIFRQASSFKKMGRNKEAKLFFQELIEKHPKSAVSAKAKQELRHLK